MYSIFNGPTADMIFTAARHATTPTWRTPLHFTIHEVHDIEITWINGPTWLGEHSRFLTFQVKYQGHEFTVTDYDVQKRSGDLYSPGTGTPGNLLDLIVAKRATVIDRVQRAL